jgi:hypothetical protein
MNLTFIVPLIGYGVFLHATQFDVSLLLLTLASVAALWLQQRHQGFDLAEQVRFVGDRVFLGERRLSLFPILWGSAIRNRVYEAAFLDDPITKLDCNKTFSTHIGVTKEGELVPQPISNRTPHALLVGPSGSGKTELMRLVATHFDAEIWSIDFNSGIGLKDVPRLSLQASENCLDVLDLMKRELRARGQRTLQPRLLLAVDGLDLALQNKTVYHLVQQIASQGRALNVMLLLSSQTLSGVPRTIWVNCANRFSLGADLESRVQLGFCGRSASSFGDWGEAEMLQGQRLVSFRFPLGFRNEKTASAETETVNPLLTRVSSTPQ